MSPVAVTPAASLIVTVPAAPLPTPNEATEPLPHTASAPPLIQFASVVVFQFPDPSAAVPDPLASHVNVCPNAAGAASESADTEKNNAARRPAVETRFPRETMVVPRIGTLLRMVLPVP